MNPLEALQRRVFGVPMYVYGATVVAVIWAVWWWRKRSGVVTSENDAASLGEELGLGSGSFDLSGHLEDTGLDNPTPGTGTGGENTVPDSRPKTNAEWFSFAYEYLTTTYGLSETDVTNALRDYLQGKTPPGNAWAWVMLVLGKYGSPPEGRLTPPPNGEPPPITNPPPQNNPLPTHATAPAGKNLYDWTNEQGVDFITVFGREKNDPAALNPSARNSMRWSNSTPKIPTFAVSTYLRIR